MVYGTRRLGESALEANSTKGHDGPSEARDEYARWVTILFIGYYDRIMMG